MGTNDETARLDLLPGTLDLLILKTLARVGPAHGYGIARFIRQTSDDVLRVEEGSLYPALQRMLVRGWVSAEWRVSEHNRRARYYRLTASGRRQLASELSDFERIVRAIMLVTAPAASEA